MRDRSLALSAVGLVTTLAFVSVGAGSPDRDWWTAVAQNDTAKVAALAREEPKRVGMPGGMGWTALHMAAADRHEELARVLVDLGAPLDARGSERETPLHLAIRKPADGASEIEGQVAIVRMLLEHGADAGARDGTGATPLHWAAIRGDEMAAELLLEHGADVNDLAKKARWTPLHGAAGSGHAGVVQILLDHGADPALRDRDGMTARQVAEQAGHPAIAELLAESGDVAGKR